MTPQKIELLQSIGFAFETERPSLPAPSTNGAAKASPKSAKAAPRQVVSKKAELAQSHPLKSPPTSSTVKASTPTSTKSAPSSQEASKKAPTGLSDESSASKASTTTTTTTSAKAAPQQVATNKEFLGLSDEWSSFFRRLCLYKQAHGHCCVSSSKDKDLAKWALSQFRNQKNGTLQDFQRNMLSSIGFRFPSRTVAVRDEDDSDDDEASVCSSDYPAVPPPDPTHAPIKISLMAALTRSPAKTAPPPAVNLVKRNAKPPAPLKVPLTPPESASKKEASKESASKKETAPSVAASPPPKPVVAPQVAKKTAAAPVAPSKSTVLPSKVNKRQGAAKEIWCGAPDDELEGGWPPGWTKRTFERTSGKTKGSTDSYWYAPEGGKRLRSMAEVRRHLGLKEVSTRKRPRTQVSFVASAKAAKWADSGTKHVVKDGPAKKRSRMKKPVKKATGPRFTQEDIHLVRASMLNGAT